MHKYQSWIKNNTTNYNDAYGKCKEVTQKMQNVFPELTLIRGFYHCPIWKQRCHWWLVDSQNNVIDPTARQFPSNGSGEYIRWNEKDKEPTGKCINCGEYCYDGGTVCSDKCGREFVKSLV